MRFAFSADQEELRRGARRFLDAHSPSKSVREQMATERGWDPAVWRRIGVELGWPSLIIPEQYGGSGYGQVELVGLMEEMGRALLCAPFFSSVCLATNCLLSGADEAQKAHWLPALASGESTATLAWVEQDGRWDASTTQARFVREGDDFLITGQKSFVLDGHTADWLIVAARGDQAELALFLVPATSEGLSRRALTTMDQTRKQAEIVLAGVRVPADHRLAGDGLATLERTLDLAAAALAAEQVGGADRCLEMAVDYAKVRVQFNRPIGSFQAIKHKCAEMLVRVESARSAAYYAGWAAAESPADLPLAASQAKAYCSDAYFHCAAENIQIHGGIGFTWEHDAHLYFKRARSSEALLGDAAYHRERFARRMGL